MGPFQTVARSRVIYAGRGFRAVDSDTLTGGACTATSGRVHLLLEWGLRGLPFPFCWPLPSHWALQLDLLPLILSLHPVSLKPVFFVSGPSLTPTPFCQLNSELTPSSESLLDSTGAGFCAWFHVAGKWDLSVPVSSGRVD